MLTILMRVGSSNSLWSIILTICILSLHLAILQVHSEAKHVKFSTVLIYKSRP
jgi:hypothetical protein